MFIEGISNNFSEAQKHMRRFHFNLEIAVEAASIGRTHVVLEKVDFMASNLKQVVISLRKDTKA